MIRSSLLVLLALCHVTLGFVATHPPRSIERRRSTILMDSLDVVLFGIGDLRTDDHEGLGKAIENSIEEKSKILPMVMFDGKSLSNVPGAVAHTIDTADMIAAAVKDLKSNLKKKMNLPLSTYLGGGDESGSSISDQLLKILQPYQSSTMSKIRIHVCDSGDADNQMGYTPISQLSTDDLPSNIELCSWSCNLREGPWDDIEKLPLEYSDYSKLYKDSVPDLPIATTTTTTTTTANEQQQLPLTVDDDVGIRIAELDDLPHTKQIYDILEKKMELENHICVEEINSGLYATHWGGLDHASVGENSVSETIRAYVEDCDENDELFATLPNTCTRNDKSLEHATMVWNLRGDGTKETPNPNNIIAGEELNRYLLAPLFLGTVSPRTIWHASKSKNPFFESPMKTLVETREWHKLLAAKNIRTDPAYRGESPTLNYKYWRWHGFLCRYAESASNGKTADDDKDGILLIHGFGASGAQWSKTIDALQQPSNDDDSVECLAPDLIGFGQSEKPPITYCGYNWEINMNDFIKEIAVSKNKCNWEQFVIGGNSIGGFVGICAAANDATLDKHAVSGGGAPGTGKCTGAVLMNSAGVIQSREEVANIESMTTDDSMLKSVAQITATDSLSPAKPIPRPLARAFGEGLLAYLRPRIQSICVNLYPTNPDAVDSTLCDSIRRDSLDPGAINVMISGSKLPAPRTYNEVIAADFGRSRDMSLKESTFEGPALVAQGVLDPLNDAKGRAEMLGSLRQGIKVEQIPGGHCPHDELPEEIAKAILDWLVETKEDRTAFLGRQQQTSEASSSSSAAARTATTSLA